MSARPRAFDTVLETARLVAGIRQVEFDAADRIHPFKGNRKWPATEVAGHDSRTTPGGGDAIRELLRRNGASLADHHLRLPRGHRPPRNTVASLVPL